jgi:SAM-dependent methyltransferase
MSFLDKSQPTRPTLLPTGAWAGETAHLFHHTSTALAEWLVEYLDDQKDVGVLDLGCGVGGYLAALKEKGFTKLLGVEAQCPKHALFEPIAECDLSVSFDLPFEGHVLCFEVAEHLPRKYEQNVVRNIARHVASGHEAIISWAVPGQGGYGHFNEQPIDYVIDLFEDFGMDFLEATTAVARSRISDEHDPEHGKLPWFKNTLMVFGKGKR